MNHYRLLRDNKESGPYSQEEMIAKGFKPYDLIWVEGKSAGWRYPSEIPELKAFAPVVEEQPYDRFYKKPVQQKHSRFEERPSVSSFSATMTRKEESRKEELKEDRAITKHSYTIQPIAGRHIHVALPSANNVNTNTVTTIKEPIDEKRNYQPLVIEEEKKPSFTENISRPYPTIATENKVFKIEPAVKPSEVNNNIKKTNSFLFQQPFADFEWTTLLGLFIGIATLVGLGIMIGLSIGHTNKDAVFNTGIAKKTIPAITRPAGTAAETPIVKDDKSEELNNQASGQAIPDEDKSLVRNAVIKKRIDPLNAIRVDSQLAVNGSGVNHENSVENIPPDNPPKKPAIVPSVDFLTRQINLTTHGYKVGAFGGISDLQCTLVNDSKYALDMVEVEVQYIQANDKIYKTEILSFKDIAAGTRVTLNAPKSSRGIKVTGRIIKINSKESGLLNTTVKS
jgi:hypothetical protein